MLETEKCRYTSSVFIKVLQANKIISKYKKIFLPTYPNFKKHVTGNTIFLFGLMSAGHLQITIRATGNRDSWHLDNKFKDR